MKNAGNISHQIAKEKSELEYKKYKQQQKNLQRCESLKELEKDIKKSR